MSIELAEYLVDLEEFPRPEVQLHDMIGQDHLPAFLLGAAPSYDANENYCDFMELSGFTGSGGRTKNTAFLFSGEPGNGRKTADTAFVYRMLEFCEDLVYDAGDPGLTISDALKYYDISGMELTELTKDETCQRIDALFDSIEEILCDEENEGVMIYISFGDVTELLGSKKTARRLSKRIERLTASENGMCIITCIFSGTAAKLNECVKRAFYIYQFSAPDVTSRTLYFDRFKSRYPNINWEVGMESFTELTDGFSFLMLKQLRNMLFMLIKGKALSEGASLEKFISPFPEKEIEPITVSEVEFAAFTENVKAFLKVKKSPEAQMIYGLPPQLMQIQSEAQTQQPQTEQQSKTVPAVSEDDLGEGGDKMKMPDSFAEIDAITRNLHVPSSYVPPDYEKRKEEIKERTADSNASERQMMEN